MAVLVTLARAPPTPLAPALPVQTTFRGVVPAGVQRRRTTPITRTAASDVPTDEGVALEGLARGLAASLAAGLGPGAASHEPDDTCA